MTDTACIGRMTIPICYAAIIDCWCSHEPLLLPPNVKYPQSKPWLTVIIFNLYIFEGMLNMNGSWDCSITSIIFPWYPCNMISPSYSILPTNFDCWVPMFHSLCIFGCMAFCPFFCPLQTGCQIPFALPRHPVGFFGHSKAQLVPGWVNWWTRQPWTNKVTSKNRCR